MKEGLRRFFAGRNGHDALNRFLSVAAIVVMVLSLFIGRVILYPLALALMLYSIFRMLSKNTTKRGAENRAFLRMRGKAAHAGQNALKRFKQRKTHRFYKCPSCRVWVRVPKGRGNLTIVCTRCRSSFDKTT